MTDKEILKRVEDRLDVAITLLTLSGDKYSAQVVTAIFNYIGKCKHVQKKLRISSQMAESRQANVPGKPAL